MSQNTKKTKELTALNTAFLISLGYTKEQIVNATNFMCDQARKPGVTDQRASVNAALEKANARAEYQPREKMPQGVHQYKYPAMKGFGANKKAHPKAGQWNGSYLVVGPNGEQLYGRPEDFRYLASVLPTILSQLVDKPKA